MLDHLARLGGVLEAILAILEAILTVLEAILAVLEAILTFLKPIWAMGDLFCAAFRGFPCGRRVVPKPTWQFFRKEPNDF